MIIFKKFCTGMQSTVAQEQKNAINIKKKMKRTCTPETNTEKKNSSDEVN